ncbi:MAG: hypothetical protein LC104_03120 [Bacteroidales bacterium]|nr:hypothetical protein [Bacteroidales bacterium]
MYTLPRMLLLAVLALAPVASVRSAELEPLLPAETESVVMINVRQVLDSSLFKKYGQGQVEQALQGNDAQQVLKEIGLDPMKDIERVVGGTWGTGPEDMKALFVVRGKFDPAKLFAAIKQAAKSEPDKVEILSEGKYKLVKLTVENQDKPFYASVANEKSIVVSNDKKLVVNALADAQKGAKPRLKKDLAELVKSQDDSVSLYAVGLTAGKVELPPNFSLPIQGVDPEKLEKQLQAIKHAAIVLNITDGLNLSIAMGMADAASAKEFGGTVDQLVNTARVFIPVIAAQQPQFRPLADELSQTLQSKVNQKSVSLSLKISGKTISKSVGGGE